MTHTILGITCALLLAESVCSAAIVNPLPPEKGKQIAYAHLKESIPGFLKVPEPELALADPHQDYFVGLKTVANGELLSRARLFSWRYLVLRGEEAIAEIHLNANQKAGPLLKVLSIGAGPQAEATLIALRKAEQLPQVQANDYELRLLRAPALHLTAVWLQRDSEDILIPLELGPLPKGLVPNQAYSEAEFINILKPVAQENIKMHPNADPR